jgi:hypothetical protein
MPRSPIGTRDIGFNGGLRSVDSVPKASDSGNQRFDGIVKHRDFFVKRVKDFHGAIEKKLTVRGNSMMND